MKRGSKIKKGHVIAMIVILVLLLAGATVITLALYGKKQAEKIPALTAFDCLHYTLEGSDKGVITVGIIMDGKTDITVYGKDGKVQPRALHTYEIGSLTKTFTAALIARAVSEGKLALSDTLDSYLALPSGNTYPTIAELLTHTSGFRDFYFETPMIGNFLAGRNDFCGITDDNIMDKLKTLSIKKGDYPFKYSNYSFAVLGLVLENIYGEDYTALVNSFAADIGLEHTHISTGDGDLGAYWDWKDGDAYLAAGALTSNIEDMLKYAQLQLDGSDVFNECHAVIKDVSATTDSNKMMNINLDSIGMAWIIDKENGIIWHNGGTGSYNAYLGFCPASGTAVVVLSNLSPNYRIPATVIGVKLLTELG